MSEDKSLDPEAEDGNVHLSMSRLNALIYTTAVDDNASVIHIDPGADSLTIRFRIDNQLHDVMNPPKHVHLPIVETFKAQADMDMAERRVPQIGRHIMEINDREFRVETSTFPTVHGEKLVLHLRAIEPPQMGLGELNLSSENLGKIRAVISRGSGILLFAGSWRSGKTSNMYACLDSLDKSSHNIFTIEEQVSRRLENVNQIQLREKIGLTGPSTLRSVMKGDPDVIAVQRMETRELFSEVLKAYRPGRLVLAGCYVKDAAHAVVRLRHATSEPFLTAGAFQAAWAQALLPKICEDCKQEHAAPAGIAGLPEGTTIYKGVGCPACHERGCRGLVGVQEVLVTSDELQEAVLSCAPYVEINELVDVPLRADALTKVEAGLISLEEFVRAFPADSD